MNWSSAGVKPSSTNLATWGFPSPDTRIAYCVQWQLFSRRRRAGLGDALTSGFPESRFKADLHIERETRNRANLRETRGEIPTTHKARNRAGYENQP